MERWIEDERTSKRWILLAVTSLLLSGLLALFIAGARTPILDTWVDDPLFFRRSLVIHVDLALLVWVFACIAAIFRLVPSSRTWTSEKLGIWLAWGGVLLLLASAAAKGSKPILANYIPVVDHPLFLLGLGVFGLGVFLSFLSPKLVKPPTAASSMLPKAARIAIRASALAFLLAVLTLLASWIVTPRIFSPEAYFEHLVWGAGHVLQIASVLAMVAIWILLLERRDEAPILSPRAIRILSGLLVAPALAAPLLALWGPASRGGFTLMMRWGIFPPVTLILLACLAALHRRRRSGAPLLDAGAWGFFASAGLTVLGFTLGAMIRGSNTMIPAHYHAAIGGVTAALMAGVLVLLPRLGVSIRARSMGKPPMVFAIGQGVFALGFALAGAFGMGRKVYGTEQLERSLPETIGLAVMGIGGIIAAVGGLLFLSLVLFSWRRAKAASPHHRRSAWAMAAKNTPSRD